MSPSEIEFINWYYAVNVIGMIVGAVSILICTFAAIINFATNNPDIGGLTFFISVVAGLSGFIFLGISAFEFTKVYYSPSIVLKENAHRIPLPSSHLND